MRITACLVLNLRRAATTMTSGPAVATPSNLLNPPFHPAPRLEHIDWRSINNVLPCLSLREHDIVPGPTVTRAILKSFASPCVSTGHALAPPPVSGLLRIPRVNNGEGWTVRFGGARTDLHDHGSRLWNQMSLFSSKCVVSSGQRLSRHNTRKCRSDDGSEKGVPC